MRTMLDTVTPGVLRGTPIGDVYAGYVGGHWADADAIRRDFPGHLFVSIAIAQDEDADFCDCEQMDLTPAEVAPWILRQHRRGVWRPGVYANESTMPAFLPTLARTLPRNMYRLWLAKWDNRPDLPHGFDAHQYQDHGPHGENYDMSVVADDFFPTHRPPAPPAHHHHLAEAHVGIDLEFDILAHAWNVKGSRVTPEPWGDK